MAYLEINPEHQEFFDALGLRDPEDFLHWQGTIVSGHPDRHVLRVEFGEGESCLRGFMKREHRVPLRQRLANLRAGFGPVSHSRREAMTLKKVSQLGLAPQIIAAGENGRGQAFLLVRELPGFVDLRLYLRQLGDADSRVRRDFARCLGQLLATLHRSGFDHSDLYSKHVLVHPATREIRILDWQRSRRRPSVGRKQRYRDLAALDATVASVTASTNERRICLRAYGRASGWDRATLRDAQREIARRARALGTRRRIRELQQTPFTGSAQHLLWLDGEALCMTPEYYASLNGRIPNWLSSWHRSPNSERRTVLASLLVSAEFSQRTIFRPLTHAWSWLRGTRPTAPEVRQAGLILRLQRYGISTPKLLAFGQRQTFPGRTDSFLLTESVSGGVPLEQWLREFSDRVRWTAERKQRWQVIRATGQLLRRLHDAGCHLATPQGDSPKLPVVVEREANGTLGVAIRSVALLKSARRTTRRRVILDLRLIERQLADNTISATDKLRFVLAYTGANRVTPKIRQFIRFIVSRRRWPTVIRLTEARR